MDHRNQLQLSQLLHSSQWTFLETFSVDQASLVQHLWLLPKDLLIDLTQSQRQSLVPLGVLCQWRSQWQLRWQASWLQMLTSRQPLQDWASTWLRWSTTKWSALALTPLICFVCCIAEWSRRATWLLQSRRLSNPHSMIWKQDCCQASLEVQVLLNSLQTPLKAYSEPTSLLVR